MSIAKAKQLQMVKPVNYHVNNKLKTCQAPVQRQRAPDGETI